MLFVFINHFSLNRSYWHPYPIHVLCFLVDLSFSAQFFVFFFWKLKFCAFQQHTKQSFGETKATWLETNFSIDFNLIRRTSSQNLVWNKKQSNRTQYNATRWSARYLSIFEWQIIDWWSHTLKPKTHNTDCKACRSECSIEFMVFSYEQLGIVHLSVSYFALIFFSHFVFWLFKLQHKFGKTN